MVLEHAATIEVFTSGIKISVSFEEIIQTLNLQNQRDLVLELVNKLSIQADMRLSGPNSLDVTKDVHLMVFSGRIFFYRNSGYQINCDLEEVL